MLSVIRRASDLRTTVGDWRASRRTVGFVPTMGALHEGHSALIRASLAECDKTVVSIFVNPMQFDRADDLQSYPRDDEGDRRILEDLGVNLLYLPRPDRVYPPGFCTRVEQSHLTERLCGRSRPGHFTGVLTVVLKLLNVVCPDVAFFGQKDFQQARVVQRMVRDLDVPVRIRTIPIVREADGLALSSRNVLLLPEHREAAPGIHRALQRAQAAFESGERSAEGLIGLVREMLESLPDARVDYVELCDPEDLEPRTDAAREGDLLAVAVYFGSVRLIDNVLLGPREPA